MGPSRFRFFDFPVIPVALVLLRPILHFLNPVKQAVNSPVCLPHLLPNLEDTDIELTLSIFQSSNCDVRQVGNTLIFSPYHFRYSRFLLDTSQ